MEIAEKFNRDVVEKLSVSETLLYNEITLKLEEMNKRISSLYLDMCAFNSRLLSIEDELRDIDDLRNVDVERIEALEDCVYDDYGYGPDDEMGFPFDITADAIKSLKFDEKDIIDVGSDIEDEPKTKAERKLVHNRIKCLKCGDIIESKSVHDYVKCNCGACATDGGTDYMSITANPGDWADLSEWEDVKGEK